MRFGIRTLDEADLQGKTVLCRVDINQPVDRQTGTLKSINRITACVPTIRELSDKGAKVVLLAHQGSDIEYKNYYCTQPHARVLEKLLDNFDHRFDEEMRAQIETLNANVTGGDYTVREVAIVASMIEKEAAAPSEAPAIAGVIYNRLFKWDGTPAYLNIDASIVYALNGKSDLTKEDLQVDSPYNTYTHTGLTPTPISNPGLSSLRAALNPESHNYYYYVLNPETGMHTFSTTYEEHSANVAAYAEGQ